VLVAAGCGGGDPLPSQQVERRIQRELLQPVGIGGKVECPSGIDKDEGEDFTCEITLGRRVERVRVIQRDDKGHLNFRPLPSR
jgi:hypothetical protein